MLLHLNTRSLPKNQNKLEDLLSFCEKLPEFIAITETKLNATNITQIDLENYNFEHVNSNTNAGGVGIFVLRKDLQFHDSSCENIWIEIFSGSSHAKVSTVVGVIYRHPHSPFEAF